MERLKQSYRETNNFRLRVIQWRSSCTVPYLFIVNALFWYVVFYTSNVTQMQLLAALVFIVFCNDVLFSPTHDRSIIVQMLIWPIRSLWKTLAVVLSGVGIHQLRENKEEEALWCSAGALSCLLIAPVYEYNEVNKKITNSFQFVKSFIKTFLTYWIVRPVLYVGELFRYVFCFHWLPDIQKWFSSLKKNFSDYMDRIFLTKWRTFKAKCVNFFYYWVYFQWLTDLRHLIFRHVGAPLLERLRVVRDYLVYVFGGYWFAPLMRHAANATYVVFCYATASINRCIVAFGNSVIYPLLVAMGKQLMEVSYVVYNTFGRPVVAELHLKYKHVEDIVLIYIIGPAVKKLIDSVPEKNPFVDEHDDDLNEFLPKPAGEEMLSEEDLEEDLQTSVSITNPVPELKQEYLDDLDDDSFLTRRLQRELSVTDSSDEEFLLYPSRSATVRRRNKLVADS